MLKRVHIKGYKSLVDVEVKLEPLTMLFGPNAAGKSNFLDALQLLSRIGASRTLGEAFDAPYRGKPLESFPIGKEGVKGLIEQERLTFSIEADLELADAVADAVNRHVRNMRLSSGRTGSSRRAANWRAGSSSISSRANGCGPPTPCGRRRGSDWREKNSPLSSTP